MDRLIGRISRRHDRHERGAAIRMAQRERDGRHRACRAADDRDALKLQGVQEIGEGVGLIFRRWIVRKVDASGLWPDKVVTTVEPAGPLWEAEPEHQDYLERIPDGYTCHFVRPNWKLPRRTAAM
jgi:hypothetical protein